MESAQLIRPSLIRNNDDGVVRGEGQLSAAYSPIAFPGPIDDLLSRWLEPNVAPAEVLRQKIKIAIGLVDHRSAPRSKIQFFWNINPNWEYLVRGNSRTKARLNARSGVSVKETQR
jgi:hypothetical protein